MSKWKDDRLNWYAPKKILSKKFIESDTLIRGPNLPLEHFVYKWRSSGRYKGQHSSY